MSIFEEKFFKAIEENNLKLILNYLIKSPSSINSVNDKGQSPLMLAILYSSDKVIEHILKYKPRINIKDNNGETAIFYAIRKDNFIVTKKLISMGADINIRNNYGMTLLNIAVSKSNEDIVTELFNKNIDITVLDTWGQDILTFCDKYTDVENPNKMFPLLLQNMTDVYLGLLAKKPNKARDFEDKFSEFKKHNEIFDILKLLSKNNFLEFHKKYNEGREIFILYKYFLSKYFSTIGLNKENKDELVKLCVSENVKGILAFIKINNFSDSKIMDILKPLAPYLVNEIKEGLLDYEIEELLSNHKFRDADLLCKKYNIDTNWYLEKRKRFVDQYLVSFLGLEDANIREDVITGNIFSLFYRNDLSLESLEKIEEVLPIEQIPLFQILLRITNLLRGYKFKEADEYFNAKRTEANDKYIKIKAKYVQEYFHNVILPKNSEIKIPNQEQAEAIANPCQNILVTARAGSGKTATIVNKTIFEIEKYGLEPSNVRILAFNANVGEELNNRLKYSEKIASTFHSLAYEICKDREKGLQIVDTDNASPNKSSIITKILEDNLSLPTREKMYSAIKNSCLKTRDGYCGQMLMEDPEVLISLPQKYMADFLFEHKLQLAGEELKFDLGGYLFRYNNKSHSADFKARTKDRNIYIRYISSPEESVKQVFYNPNVRRKQEDILLEFCSPFPLEEILKERNLSLHSLRDKFEKDFQDFLQNSDNNITCLGRKENEELLTAFFENYKPHFHAQCESLINHYQQKKWNSKEIKENISNFISKHPFHEYRYLLEISVTIYEQYKDYLKCNNKIDFNTLMMNAAKKLELIVENKELPKDLAKLKQKIGNWKLLCIDEFQDFSQLFFDLIKQIKAINPTIKLFCVGDDWQAINGFAGSDTKFFTLFEENIKKTFKQDAGRNMLRTNYRSTEEVLDMSNFFMHQMGEHQEGAKGIGEHQSNGLTFIEEGGQYFIKLRSLSFEKKVSLNILTKADALSQIMKNNSLENPNYFILARREKVVNKLNNIYSDFLKETNDKYKHGFYISDKDFTFYTIHKSKGLERDIVVILVDKNSYPLYHPTSQMMQEIFGLRWKEEERNLFYVALTRSKRKVYFITEEGMFERNEFTKIISSYKGLRRENYKGVTGTN